MKFAQAGIRPRLLALICISLLPMVLFALFLAWERQADESQEARDKVLLVARLVVASQANILAQSQQLLAGLVVGSELADDPLTGPDCSAQLRRISAIDSLYRQAVLLRTDGTVFCAAHPSAVGLNGADRRFVADTVTGRIAAQSSLVQSGLAAGDFTILLAQPVLDRRGQVTALLVAALSLDWIEEFLRRSELPAGGGATLLNADGVVLADFSRAGSVGMAAADAAEFKAAVERADEGLMHGKGSDGRERILAYAKFAGSLRDSVYIRVAFPRSEVDDAALHVLGQMLLGFLCALVIAIAAGWAGASALVARPLRQLTDAADRLGHGDLGARTGLAYGPGEIGTLAAKLDELADHVQRKNRAFTALSAGNRLILRERDEDQLLQSMCEIAVEKAGYLVAVVFYARDDENQSLERMAFAGDDKGYLKSAGPRSWAENSGGPGTIGAAIRTGQRCVVRDVAKGAHTNAWSADFARRGFGSAASFPLIVEGNAVGALTLAASRDDAFDDEELELLDEMAADLSFGIANIRSWAQLDHATKTAERASTHDVLTNLPNGVAFFSRLTAGLKQAKALNEPLTVLLVHLTHMKELYESLGYEPGNLIVKVVADRLRAIEGVGETVARLGQEDYAVVLSNADARASETVVQDILASFHQSVHASGVHFEVQAAVGASYFPGHGDTPETLVRRATVAAHDAARRGVAYQAYRGMAQREDPQRLALATDLRRAIESKELTLFYQPKVDLRSNETTSCEALLRWKHATRGMVSPAQFVPIAEQTGLVREMTYFVLEAAVRQQRIWMAAGTPLPIAVNLSVRNLYDAQLIERIDGLLSTWGVPSELIEFEITESALMEEPDTARAAIAHLRSNGSKIYIDDFGTGYSSLSYLVSLPVHALKIDRAFVIQMTKSQQAHAVVESIISMAHSLDMLVVAEGVETVLELAMLRSLECDVVQGYYCGRPLPPEEFNQHVWPPKGDSA